MKEGWEKHSIERLCVVEYGTRVVRKVDGTIGYPVYGGGGKTFEVDRYNREDRLVISRFAMSEQCTRYVAGKFFLNDSGLTVGVKTPSLHQRFLDYQLQSLNDLIHSYGRGTAQRNLDVRRFREIELSVPPLSEQNRIVEILDNAFADIAKAKANAEQNLRNARELFESQLNEVFTKKGEGWEETTIGDRVRFIDYRGKTPAKTMSGLRLITAKNVKMGILHREPEEFVALESYDAWMTRGIPRKGDVLFTTEAPLANVAQLDTAEKVVFAQRVIIMQPDPAWLDSTFLKFMLLSKPVQERIHAKGTGATVKGIKASLLKTIEIFFPGNRTEQTAIVNQLDALSAETQRLARIYERKLEELEALKKSIMHKAFSGEL